MKFPITRESLRSIDLVKEKQEKLDITIQNHINSLVMQRDRKSYVMGTTKIRTSEFNR